MSDGAEVSPRWAQWRARIRIDDYEARFASMAAAGQASHGEADFVESYAPRSVLDAGCGTGRVAIELARRGLDVVGVDLDAEMIAAARRKAPDLPWHVEDLATFDLGRTFDLVAMAGNVMIFCRPEDRGAIVARCAGHVRPGGRLVAGFSLERAAGAIDTDEFDELCLAAGLEVEATFGGWAREPFTGADYLLAVRTRPSASSSSRPGPARVAVYTGTNVGSRPAYRLAADELGRQLAARDIGLVYGGGKVGLMGAVADAALAAGGEVIGVIPEFLEAKELAHQGLTELRVVASMHERKALMADLAVGFIALPGGFGTLEEIAEMLTWTQLGLQAKPIVFLDVEGYWSAIFQLVEDMVSAGFVRPDHRALVLRAGSAAEAVALATGPVADVPHKWIDLDVR